MTDAAGAGEVQRLDDFSGVVRTSRDFVKTLVVLNAALGMVWSAAPMLPAGGADDRVVRVATGLHVAFGGLVALAAVLLAIEGVRDHARYRALERRLAALRSPAP